MIEVKIDEVRKDFPAWVRIRVGPEGDYNFYTFGLTTDRAGRWCCSGMAPSLASDIGNREAAQVWSKVEARVCRMVPPGSLAFVSDIVEGRAGWQMVRSKRIDAGTRYHAERVTNFGVLCATVVKDSILGWTELEVAPRSTSEFAQTAN